MARTTTTILLAMVAAVCCRGAWAQDLGVKAPAQQRPVLITNATIHPISGAVIEGGSILFDNGRIVAVGRDVTDRDGRAQRINAGGAHVYPGLIGANTLMGLVEISSVRATRDYSEVGGVTPEVFASVSVNPDSTAIPVTRSNGVLTVGVMPMGGLVPGRASVVRMDGWTWEDLAVERDAGLVVNWPSLRISTGWWVRKSADEQQKDIEENLRKIDRIFDEAESYLEAKNADPSIPLDVRLDAMRGVLREGRRVFVRAQEREQIESAVAWGDRRGLDIVLVGGRDAGEVAELLARHGVGVIFTGTHRQPKRRDSAYDSIFTAPLALEEAGVRWCMATGGGSFQTPHERNLAYHAASAVAYGLPLEAGERSVTLSAAELLGVEDRLGSLEPGKSATLIITDGSPLEITTSVQRAFIDGREIDLSNKQTVLRDKYREKYRQLGLIDE